MSRPGGFFALVPELPTVGLEKLRACVRARLRSAYAGEAPEEATRKRNGRYVHRALRTSDVEASSVDSLDPDELPAEAASVEEAVLQKEIAGRVTGAIDSLIDRFSLAPANAELVRDYASALRSGYRISGKKGNSLRQLWPTDYEAKRKRLERIRKSHPGLLERLEKACK